MKQNKLDQPLRQSSSGHHGNSPALAFLRGCHRNSSALAFLRGRHRNSSAQLSLHYWCPLDALPQSWQQVLCGPVLQTCSS